MIPQKRELLILGGKFGPIEPHRESGDEHGQVEIQTREGRESEGQAKLSEEVHW